MVDDLASAAGDSAELSSELDAKSAPADRKTAGPFDLSESNEVRPVVDLGALRIFPRPGLQLRLEIEENTRRPVAVSLEFEGSTLQMQVFAAPRSSGLWHEIRAQIAEQILKQGGKTKESSSDLGPQLLAELPVISQDKSTSRRKVIFIGVDGPRWFLRGVVTGKAAEEAAAWRVIEDIFRSVIVVRGNNPMPPKELIPLKAPVQTTAVKN